MHTRLTVLPALTLTLAMLAVAGCGGSSSKTQTSANSTASTASAPAATTTAASATTSTARTPADAAAPQLKARIEAICMRRSHALAAVTTSIANVTDLKRVMGGRMAIEQNTLKALRKLSVPASLTAPWRQFIAFRGDLIKAELILAREGLRKDQGTELQAVSQAEQEMLAVAKREGFTTCAQT